MYKRSTVGGFALGLLASSLIVPAFAAPQESKPPEKQKKASEGQIADMVIGEMSKAKKLTQPGEKHKLLEKFIGDWETETKFPHFPGNLVYKGTAKFEWLMDGRWLKGDVKGTLFGQPSHAAYLMGYDSFKKTFVNTAVSSLDTAMNRGEGHATRDKKAIILYGTIDEYLTGEQDKPVKYIWRLLGDDEFLQEVHDLAIGETNTKVVEIKFKRVKKS